MTNVIKYLFAHDWEEEVKRASLVYMSAVLEEDREELMALFDQEPELENIFSLHFHEWLLSDHEDAEGRNPIDDYLERRGWQETPRGQAWLHKLRDHRMSLYEICEVQRAEGMTLRDALRGGEPIRVYEKTATKTLRQWDYIATRVVPFEGRNLLSGSGLHFTRDMAREIIEEMCEDREDHPDWESYLRGAAPVFIANYLEPFLCPPDLPELRTVEGDPLCFGQLGFKYPANLRPRLLAAFEEHPQFVSMEKGNFKWVESEEAAGEPGGRILGHIELGKTSGKFETQSKARMERGAELLRAILPEAVEFSFPVYEDPWQAAENSSVDDEPEPLDIPSDEMSAIIKQVLDQQYANWCDEPIPALEGKTPREAIKTKTGRRGVIELLKDYENSNVRMPPEQQYDFGWMWEALGLDRDDAIETDFDPGEEVEAMLESRSAILNAVQEQMDSGEIPEVRQTCERLMKTGHTRDEAVGLIGCVLLSEVNDMMKNERYFDDEGYVRMLHNLPRLPWE